MKYKLWVKASLILLILFLTAANGFSQILDLRTKLEEKIELSPIKNGAMYYLFDAGYTVFEIAEDYAVWIKDYEKATFLDGTVEISFTVTITEPTSLYEKSALAEKLIAFSYHPGKPETITLDESAARFLRKKIVRLSKQVEIEATMGGQLVRDAVIELLEALSISE